MYEMTNFHIKAGGEGRIDPFSSLFYDLPASKVKTV